MTESKSGSRDVASWEGPFFAGAPETGRHVYILRNQGQRRFTALGTLDGSHQFLFKVHGTEAQLEAFVEQVKQEGAKVTYGMPPFDTNPGGDKPTSDTIKPGSVKAPTK